MKNARTLICCAVLSLAVGTSFAETLHFEPKELFRIPFGKNRESLGARIEGGNFLIPRDFTIDTGGHFYIYDSNNHRIARYSYEGKYELGLNYPATAGQVFAHADSRQNLWVLISDPVRGLYYGVYDPRGKSLRSGIFSRFDAFRLHVDDGSTLHVILSSKKDPAALQTYILDEEALRMKKENIARPPEDHHQVRKSDRLYFLDKEPGASGADAHPVTRVSDASHRSVAEIKGEVIYISEEGDIYTRVGPRELHVYAVDGRLKGKIKLTGLPSSCQTIRFDSQGTIYQLDGIPDAEGRYTAAMPGMRVLVWNQTKK